MKNPLLNLAIALLPLCAGCYKSNDIISEKVNFEDTIAVPDSFGFIPYTIKSGQHFAQGNTYKPVELDELSFIVRFDSTAIYRSQKSENQYDINKLYGFSDNNGPHHEYSGRIGWRWSDGALRLFGYVYNKGVLSSKEISTVDIGVDVRCTIKITQGSYLFFIGAQQDSLLRHSPTDKAKGYMLYPYFGGDETAPHDVVIKIKNM